MLSKILICLSLTALLTSTPALVGLATPAAAATLSVGQDDITDDGAGDGGGDAQDAGEPPEPEVYRDTDAELSVTEGSDEDDEPSIALIAGAFVVLAAAVALGFWWVVNRGQSRSG